MTPRLHARSARALMVLCAALTLVAGQFIVTGGGGPVRAAIVAMAAATPDDPQPGAPEVPPTEPSPDSAPPQRALARPAPTGLAQNAVLEAESVADPRVELGVAVLDRLTDELAVGSRGSEQFYTASLSKVVVAVDILDRRQLEGLVLTEPDLDLLRRALGPSDDNAMNALWSRFDGQGAAARVSARLGLSGTTAPRDPSQWGEMSVVATDIVLLWQHILASEPSVDRDLLVSAMNAAPAKARDGFNQAFGLLSPDVRAPGGPGAVAKQGWMCCFSGKYYLHSAGAVGTDQRYVVVLLARIPRGAGWDFARAQLDDVAATTVKVLG